MAEMKLFIKPVFDKQSSDKFVNDINKGIGGGGSGGAGKGNTEQKKQTNLLADIGKWAKIGATVGALFSAPQLIAQAEGVAKGIFSGFESIIKTQLTGSEDTSSVLARSFRGGQNTNTSIASQIEAGGDLNEILNEEAILREANDEIIQRQNNRIELQKAIAEGNTSEAARYRDMIKESDIALDGLSDTWDNLDGIVDGVNGNMGDLETAAKNFKEDQEKAGKPLFLKNFSAEIKHLISAIGKSNDEFGDLIIASENVGTDGVKNIIPFILSIEKLHNLLVDSNDELSLLTEPRVGITGFFDSISKVADNVVNAVKSRRIS